MEPQQVGLPEWLLAYVGRQAILAEAQRIGDAATIAALRADVERLQPNAKPAGAEPKVRRRRSATLAPVAEPPGNGAVHEHVAAGG